MESVNEENVSRNTIEDDIISLPPLPHQFLDTTVNNFYQQNYSENHACSFNSRRSWSVSLESIIDLILPKQEGQHS